MNTPQRTNSFRPLTMCSIPLMLLAVAACDSDGELPSDINISISDGSDDTPTDPPVADSPAVAEARALLAGLEADGGTPYDVNDALEYPPPRLRP